MYHTVDLQDCSLRVVKSWCLAVTRHAPLAQRVHSLSMQLPSTLEPTDAGKLSRALALCVNIKRLNMSHDPELPPAQSVQTWILADCGFHLVQFINSYFVFLGSPVFFDGKDHLRLLSLPVAPRSPCSDTQLRNLVAIDAPLRVVVDLPGSRPLERIQIRCQRSESPSRLSSLSRYASTLKTLTVVRQGVEWGTSTVDIVREIAQALPNLHHFGINEDEKLVGSCLQLLYI